MQSISCRLTGSTKSGFSQDRFSSSSSRVNVGKKVSGSNSGPSDSMIRWMVRSPMENERLMIGVLGCTSDDVGDVADQRWPVLGLGHQLQFFIVTDAQSGKRRHVADRRDDQKTAVEAAG